MICIDPRAGSVSLPKIFPRDMVVVTELPAGDLLLTSHDGDQFWTAVEFKRVPDVLACIVTGRFAGTQLPAMAEMIDDYWLLIEGPMRQGPDGQLMIEIGRDRWVQGRVGSRFFDWSDLQTWIITMTTCTPLKIKVTQSRLETRDWIMTLHAWWERGKEKHRSHMVLDHSREKVDLVRASLVREWAEKLPGVAHGKAVKVDQYFANAFDMAVADTSEWVKIDGIGQLMAERIVGKIRGGSGYGR